MSSINEAGIMVEEVGVVGETEPKIVVRCVFILFKGIVSILKSTSI